VEHEVDPAVAEPESPDNTADGVASAETMPSPPADPQSPSTVGGPRWQQVTAEHVGTAATVAAGRRPPARPAAIARDRFDIEQELGRGGMGVVVAATDKLLARRVAIKQALTHRAEDLQRFEREVRITAQLEHPSIVPIYDAGRDDRGQPYYVMRRIEGELLSDRVARTAMLRDRIALIPNVVAAADAAAFAHAHGIIHRDIKPHNILLGAHGETSLIDWGLARELGDSVEPVVRSSAPAGPELTQAGQVYGTLGFMPPEQARAEPVDTRADVYALGATLYFVLSGDRPIAGDLAGALAKLGDEVPGELRAIVAKATAERREQRYRDAGELAKDLHSFLAGRLVGAHRYTRRERLRRFVRRYRVVLALGAVAVIAGVALGALAVENITHDRDLANVARRDAEARQRLAVDNAEVALLDRAAALAPRDPTRAAALLRQLPPQSRHLPRARDIAASAASAGIAHGIRPHAGGIHALALSPDATLLASGGVDGTLQLHELATRRSRVVFRGESPQQIVWGTAGTFAFTSGGSLHVFDTATDTERAVEPEIHTQKIWRSDAGDRLRYFDARRRLVAERGFRDDAETVLARDVDDVTAAGEVFVIKRRGRFEVHSPGPLRVLPPETWNTLAISTDRSRVAALAGGGQVIEVELASGAERRWPVLDPNLVVYGPSGLYAFQLGWASTLLKLGPRGVTPIATGGGGGMWSTEVAGQLAVVVQGGGLWVVGANGVKEIAFPSRNALAIEGRRDGSLLAIATADGEILWWNLDYLFPKRLPAPLGKLCGLDERSIVLATNLGLTVIDRASGASREVETPLGLGCTGLAGDYVLLHDVAGRRTVFDLRAARLDDRLGHSMISHDAESGVVVGIDERGVIRELDGRNVVERGRASSPRLVAVKGPWIVVQASDRTLVRIDRRTGERVAFPDHPLAEDLVVTDAGVIWTITRELSLYRSEAGRVERVGESATPARLLHVVGGDHLVVYGQDLSLTSYDHGQRITIASAGRQREVMFLGRVAFSVETGRHLTTRYLDTGEVTVRTSTVPLQSIAGHGGEIALHDGQFIEILRETVPEDPAQLHGWLAAATNAEVDRGNRMDWRP